MPDRLEIINPQDAELKKQLDSIKWPIQYGLLRLQLRAGRVTLVTVERTIKLD